MKVRIVERDVMDPLADTAMEETPVNPIRDVGKVSLLDNTKPGADIILRTVEESLSWFSTVWAEKPAGAPAEEDQSGVAAGAAPGRSWGTGPGSWPTTCSSATSSRP